MKQYLGKTAAAAVVAGFGLLSGIQANADTYTIQSGDSFYSIAESFGLDPVQLAADNGMTIYDVITPGQQLSVPGVAQVPEAPKPTAAVATTSQASYQVKAGDSFSSIAAAYGVDMYQLASANHLGIDALIIEGQSLVIPGNSQVSEASPAPVQDSYKIPGMAYEPGINYPVGQCTWGVQKVSGWAGDWWGNAADWATNAVKEGYTVGQVPTVGSIAVWTQGAGGYGHVAYVTDVAADGRIQVLEANYAGNQTIGNHRGWFNPQKTTEGAAVYIYPR
ncbi:LysM peptidoglycan-binding domain-containing protein [Streptococcus sp. DD13]|uniref:LysM peptidoglycan-binding domain-containing protein n=1 Tax=Streptococcus sp. DD13 TaxID=1777881 RepID=UPI00079A7EB7|nr:LysM peptidoglycan-binding domain-containing protein [Streptococcus sp. DD13]KXT77976.1 Secreted antigen GbpB/SagA/PcsB, putative peptidoglycan hydrolase [Streptococcus sp. DD13]